MAAHHCDHRNMHWPAGPACPPDVGHEPGWMSCDQEPTMGPATGVLDHGPRTMCLECWQYTWRAPPPLGHDFETHVHDITNELAYDQVMHITGAGVVVPKWDLRVNATVRGYNKNIETTQTLLCKTCTKEEIARWRVCQADADYANAFLAGKTQWAADGHTNTCVCIKKYITHPHYW
jgi:hypothetical protein